MKNKTVLIINIISAIAIAIEAIIVIIIAAINKDPLFIYRELCIGLAVAGIILFAFLLLKEIKILSYDSKKFTPILFATFTFFGVLLYYLVIFVNFNDFKILFWILLVLACVIPSLVFSILNHFYGVKKQKKGPRFLVNRERNYK